MVDVTCCDVFLGSRDPGEKLRLGHRGERGREAALYATRRYGTAQRGDDFAAQRLPLALAAGMQQSDASREMVEHQQRCGRDIVQIGHGTRLGRGRAQSLEVADDVVGRVADKSTCEREIGTRSGCLRPRRTGQGGAQRLQ